jgi:SAM-dependent methyltransferase
MRRLRIVTACPRKDRHVPGTDLGLLPSVRGLDTVELGCGTGYVSSWLARRGARPIGVDNSGRQLATARRFQVEFGIGFPLIHADAERLQRDHFGMHRFDWPEAGGAVEFALTHGDMIRLLRDAGFEVEDLLEMRAPEDAETPTDPLATADWARRWPIEEAWKARKTR